MKMNLFFFFFFNYDKLKRAVLPESKDHTFSSKNNNYCFIFFNLPVIIILSQE